MRVLSVALAILAADIAVEAGVCKPDHTSASQSFTISSVESSTSTAPTTSTETSGVSSTESLTSSTDTISTESLETLTSSTTLTGTTSIEPFTTTSTEELSTTTTTEEFSTTTTSDAGPSATPGSIIGSGPVADLPLQGDGSRFIPLSFATSGSTQTLIFTLVANGQLYAGSNNNYLCVNYKDEGVLSPLVICPFDNFQNAPVSCQRSSSGTLSCTAPNGSCNTAGTCRRAINAVPFSQFYVDASQNGYFGPASGSFTGFTAIDPVLAG
ncbi:hypothetical protein ACLX1H_000805 [Fusarium chlamydosporum]